MAIHVKGPNTDELSPIVTCNETNMVAEPVGSAANENVLARVSAIEEKLKLMAKLLSTVEQQATEAVGRSVLTNVRVNNVVTRVDVLSTTSSQVEATSSKEVTGSEHENNDTIPVDPTKVTDEFVTIDHES